MREFKFRVWSIIDKKMLSWGNIFNLPAWEIFPGTPEQRTYEVMQYTGLKDKNGIEVYEGDILRMRGEDFIVEWSEGIAGFKCVAINDINHYPAFTFGTVLSLKVVGNKYENPEILIPEGQISLL